MTSCCTGAWPPDTIYMAIFSQQRSVEQTRRLQWCSGLYYDIFTIKYNGSFAKVSWWFLLTGMPPYPPLLLWQEWLSYHIIIYIYAKQMNKGMWGVANHYMVWSWSNMVWLYVCIQQVIQLLVWCASILLTQLNRRSSRTRDQHMMSGTGTSATHWQIHVAFSTSITLVLILQVHYVA